MKAAALKTGAPIRRLFETSNIQTSEGTKTGAKRKSVKGTGQYAQRAESMADYTSVPSRSQLK